MLRSLVGSEMCIRDSNIHNIYTTYTQHLYNIYTASMQRPYNIHTTSTPHTQHLYNLHTTSIQHPYNIHTTLIQNPNNIVLLKEYVFTICVLASNFLIGIIFNGTLPEKDMDPDEKECDFFRKVTGVLLRDNFKNGRLNLELGFGFRDFCVYLRVRNFDVWDDVLPQTFTCKKLDFLDDFGSEANKQIWKNDDEEKKLFIKAIDGKEEKPNVKMQKANSGGVSF